jgi:CYTH domain-containing protein
VSPPAARPFEKRLKYARVERERRFLLAGVPEGIDLRSGYQQMEDLYFPGTTLRLRRVTSPTGEVVELKLNQKLPLEPETASHRIITSVYLGAADYELLGRLPGDRLVKRRYAFPWRGTAFGIDVFQGALAGLVLAEAEAPSEDSLAAIPALPVRHVEVTEEPIFAGGPLAAGAPATSLARAAELLAKGASR